MDEVFPELFGSFDQQLERRVEEGKADSLGAKSLEQARGLVQFIKVQCARVCRPSAYFCLHGVRFLRLHGAEVDKKRTSVECTRTYQEHTRNEPKPGRVAADQFCVKNTRPRNVPEHTKNVPRTYRDLAESPRTSLV